MGLSMGLSMGLPIGTVNGTADESDAEQSICRRGRRGTVGKTVAQTFVTIRKPNSASSD
jgi:hypothetical protein